MASGIQWDILRIYLTQYIMQYGDWLWKYKYSENLPLLAETIDILRGRKSNKNPNKKIQYKQLEFSIN